MRQDARYGVRQVADVALTALSPGVNDPTTAQDAIFHLAALLRAYVADHPPVRELHGDGRRLVLAEEGDLEELLGLAFDEIRLAAADQPTVCIYLLEALSLLEASLPDEVRSRAVPAIHAHAALVVTTCERARLPLHDVERVREISARHFGGRGTGAPFSRRDGRGSSGPDVPLSPRR
jgi:uncharacterized membrane protein